jgi:Flp pilus assembly pilin Flp
MCVTTNKEKLPILELCSHHMNAIAALQSRSLKDETGQTMVEYVMSIVLVALAVFLPTPKIKDAIPKLFSNTPSALAYGIGPTTLPWSF